MEEALRQNHERFQLANRATFNAIWDWNLQTNALWWNENFQMLFGYPAEEIEPGIESWTNRIHPEDVDRIKAGIHTAIDSGQQSWSDQYRFRRKDGVYAEVEDRGYIRREANGTPVRMIGTMQDITERKQLEAEVEKAQMDFLFAVSHELKTPLLVMSAAEELVERVLEELAPLTEKKSLRLQREFDHCRPLSLDPKACVRILTNLLTNAIKFSPVSGAIRIKLREEADQAVLQILDEGPGIPANKMPNLFQPFRRGSVSVRTAVPGTGLGLYVCRILTKTQGEASGLWLWN